MGVNYTPNQNKYAQMGDFKFWCQRVLPMVYDDSLSYYEVLTKVVHYINNIIETLNNIGADTTKMYEAYNLLQGYVNEYFDNLDVQSEIDNKLDKMVSDGTLSSIIKPLFDAYKLTIDAIVTGHDTTIKNFVYNYNTKFDAIKNRMDTFTSLPIGSTSGDAEFADAHVGYNGVRYPSIGSAIRNQVDNINKAFIIEDNHGDNLLNPLNCEGGYYQVNEGVITPNNGNENRARTINPIPVVRKTGQYYLYVYSTAKDIDPSDDTSVSIHWLAEDGTCFGTVGKYFRELNDVEGSKTASIPIGCTKIHISMSGVKNGRKFEEVCISYWGDKGFKSYTYSDTRTINPEALPYSYNVLPSQVANLQQTVAGIVSTVAPTTGKKMLVFGDSITETMNINDEGVVVKPNYRVNWPVFACDILNIENIRNYAKSGATARDTGYQWALYNKSTNQEVVKPDPTNNSKEYPKKLWGWFDTWYATAEELDAVIKAAGAPVEDNTNYEWRWVKKNDTVLSRMNLSEQIKMALSDSENDDTDIVVIAIGTNDSGSLGDGGRGVDTYEDAMKAKTLDETDNYGYRATIHKALRYAMWSLRVKYPNARCYICTPLQREAFDIPILTRDAIVAMGNRYNFKVIDAYSESGIVRGLSEPNDLYDGLHTSEAGAIKQAKLISNTILHDFLYAEWCNI